jgi:hypothetical protein
MTGLQKILDPRMRYTLSDDGGMLLVRGFDTVRTVVSEQWLDWGGTNGEGEKVLECAFRAEDGERMVQLRTSRQTGMK